ncbi:MAG: conserved hypothetical rane protein [Rhodocyclales bacterium]|nr:conserved hypothetical rane protein [Rhodocyclales bacterium]
MNCTRMDKKRLNPVWPILVAAIWRFRRRTSLAVLLVVLAKLAAVSVPLVLKKVVDEFSRPEMLASIPVLLLVGYAVMRFFGTFFGEIRDVVFARVTQRTVSDFLIRTFTHLHRLSPRFHSLRQTGVLTREVERGTAGIGFLLGVALFTIVPTLVEMASVLIILAAGYSLWFTVILGLTFVLYGVFTLVFTERRAIYQRALNRLDSNANGRLVDSLLNYETVKYYTGEKIETSRFQNIMSEWIEVGIRNQKALSLLHIGQSAIIAISVAGVMLFAGDQVVHRGMTVGDLVLINAYVIQICLPLNSLGFIFREAKDASINAERLFSLLGERPEIEESPGLPTLQVKVGEVRFEHVDFGYEPSRPILHDVSFTIAAGTTVAVVGGSGSGKSTLVRLLLRFYDVGTGQISIDGQPIYEVTQESLRTAIGVVPQDTILFNDSIAYNIGYARPGASREEIEAAARSAQVHDFISSLPQGYDTMVGERGVRLSGGERQRIAIARAILKNPPILILDEATSALDTRSERSIQDELGRLARDRTALIIAHRLSTVVDAAEILVMDLGRIVERGTHDELLEREGLYAQMWRLQQHEREIEQTGRRLAMQSVDMGVLVAGVLAGLRAEMQERHIDLYTIFGNEQIRVTGNLSQLHQAAWDVLQYFMAVNPPGGRIELRLERSGANGRLMIMDNLVTSPPAGEGEPQMHAEGRSAPLPVALARAEVDTVIEEHGGHFTMWQDHTGNTAIIELPVRALASSAGASESTGADHATLSKLDAHVLDGVRVLAIDDNVEARELIGIVLEMHGAKVASVNSGREALALLATLPSISWPDIVLCDISLGDDDVYTDGYAVIRRIRELETERATTLVERLPAIALTGFATPGDRMRALLAGFQLHLAKPVDPNELVAAIVSLAGHAVRRSAAVVNA